MFDRLKFWKPRIQAKDKLAQLESSTQRTDLFIEEVRYTGSVNTKLDLVFKEMKYHQGDGWDWKEKFRLSYEKEDFKKEMKEMVLFISKFVEKLEKAD